MSHWEDALAEQVQLLRYWRSEMGETYAEGFAQDVTEKGRGGSTFYRAVPMVEARKLERAEPVFVEGNVVDLVDYAMETVKPEVLLPEDLFCQEGFALLEKPVYLEDVNNKLACFRAFSWGPCISATGIPPEGSRGGFIETEVETEDLRRRLLERPNGEELGIHVVLYAHFDDDDDYTPSLREDMRKKLVGKKKNEADALRRAWLDAWGGSALSMYHAAHLPFGRIPEELERGVREFGDKAGLTLWQFIQTFFRLAQQEVARPARTEGDRHARKRLRRIREDSRGVLVVTLRRERRPRMTEEESDVDWSCQWPVSGHWRDQWYPTLGEHRQIWIDGYVKGPEDKPFRAPKGRAFEFKR